ncbi:MAG: thioredoxin domain-containing protein, partial [Chloroflexi bacterium]|nr:thioredoxin domain-containing protein [Chloroflexota bacterium]
PEVVADSVERARPQLYEVRERRVHPGRDEKILTSWNGLMLRAIAEAARALGREDYRRVGVANAEFVLANLYRNGRLLRTHKDGQSKLNGYLEDYANYADGLLALYETTADRRWLETARVLADSIVAHFADEENGGFFDTSDDHEALVARPKDLFDNATPAGNSVAAEVLQKLAVIYGDPELGRRGVGLINRLLDALAKHPSAFGRLLCAADFAIGPVREIAVVGPSESPETSALRQVFERSYLPNRVVVFGNQAASSDHIATLPLLADRVPINGRPTAYVCEQYTCQLPVTEPAALAGQLGVKTPT